MQNRVKLASTGVVLGGALLAAGGLGLAHAAPPAESVVNDGKVNVTVTAGGQQVGTLENVSLASAEALAASACPSAGITAEAIAALDVNGTPVPGTCAGAEGGLTFTFAQNSAASTENAPGQERTTAPSSSSAPSGAPASTTTSRSLAVTVALTARIHLGAGGESSSGTRCFVLRTERAADIFGSQ